MTGLGWKLAVFSHQLWETNKLKSWKILRRKFSVWTTKKTHGWTDHQVKIHLEWTILQNRLVQLGGLVWIVRVLKWLSWALLYCFWPKAPIRAIKRPLFRNAFSSKSIVMDHVIGNLNLKIKSVSLIFNKVTNFKTYERNMIDFPIMCSCTKVFQHEDHC